MCCDAKKKTGCLLALQATDCLVFRLFPNLRIRHSLDHLLRRRGLGNPTPLKRVWWVVCWLDNPQLPVAPAGFCLPWWKFYQVLTQGDNEYWAVEAIRPALTSTAHRLSGTVLVADTGDDQCVSSQLALQSPLCTGNCTTHLGSLSTVRGFLPDQSQAGFRPPLPFQRAPLVLSTRVVPPTFLAPWVSTLTSLPNMSGGAYPLPTSGSTCLVFHLLAVHPKPSATLTASALAWLEASIPSSPFYSR